MKNSANNSGIPEKKEKNSKSPKLYFGSELQSLHTIGRSATDQRSQVRNN